MDKLVALQALKEVVDAGGFSKAAQRLGVATSSVGRLIGALEASLGQRLVTRTPRSVTLTDAGRIYMEQVTRIIADLNHADESVLDRGTQPAGKLRISVPATYSRIRLAPVLARFLREHPGIMLDVDDSDRYLDLAAERIDVAIRIGRMGRDKSLVAKKLIASPRHVVASPEYLRERGIPSVPLALGEHPCLRFAYGSGNRLARQRWTFRSTQGEEQAEVDGPMIANSLDLLFTAAVDGRGIALLPQWLVHEEVQVGRLIRLFRDYEVSPPVGEAVIYAAYLPNRRHSSKVRSFINFVENELQRQYNDFDLPAPEAGTPPAACVSSVA